MVSLKNMKKLLLILGLFAVVSTTNAYADVSCLASVSPHTGVSGQPNTMTFHVINVGSEDIKYITWLDNGGAMSNVTGAGQWSDPTYLLNTSTQPEGDFTTIVDGAGTSQLFVYASSSEDGSGQIACTDNGLAYSFTSATPTPTTPVGSGSAYLINSSVQSNITNLLASFIEGAFLIIVVAIGLVGSYWLSKKLVRVLLKWFGKFAYTHRRR